MLFEFDHDTGSVIQSIAVDTPSVVVRTGLVHTIKFTEYFFQVMHHASL